MGVWKKLGKPYQIGPHINKKCGGINVEKLLDEIESYWSTRTEGYSEVNHKELAGTQKNSWLKVLTSQFPDKPKEEIRILDIGTGPGFFPVILAEAGYHVDAVDYTEGMLEKAKENAENFAGTFISSGWMHRSWNLKTIPLMWSFPEILPGIWSIRMLLTGSGSVC